MVAILHFIAVSLYIGAAVLAAAPFARPVRAPVRSVLILLGAGAAAHVAALTALAVRLGQPPVTGLGPALSCAGLAIVLVLFLVEWVARDTMLTLVAAPLAAVPTAIANVIGLTPVIEPTGTQGAWLVAHIALSFAGIAAFATAAAAGAMYLVEHRELKSRRLGAILRAFPPLQTLDRVNHVAILAGWIGLTVGVVLAAGYSVTYREFDAPKVGWALTAWLGTSLVAGGRVLGGWQARRAARISGAAFIAVVGLYILVRVVVSRGGAFL
ncbi:MAG TPA: cytochrome c biogenesis protein CcsA [Gemmatimonadaceae bacterium]|nr:cytochrome c biogenesis protein CcsA [Gemmatimonadaceae bacterium]